MERLAVFVRMLMTSHGINLAFAFEPDSGDRIGAARQAQELILEYRVVETKLSASYLPESIPAIQVSALEIAWAEGGKKLWFFASIAQKKVTAALAEQGRVVSGDPDLERDAPLLRRMHQLLVELEKLKHASVGGCE